MAHETCSNCRWSTAKPRCAFGEQITLAISTRTLVCCNRLSERYEYLAGLTFIGVSPYDSCGH